MAKTLASIILKDNSDKLKEKLLEYFQIQSNVDILFSVLQKKATYSLRIIEWFVTNYCKKHLVTYNVNGKSFNVYKKYKDNLKSYTKEKFDPFKRTKQNTAMSSKIKIKNNKTNETIESSICQMNFFKWMITNNIHKYIDKNIILIKKDMNETAKKKNNESNKVVINNNSVPKKKQNIKTNTTTSQSSTNNKITIIKKKLVKNFD